MSIRNLDHLFHPRSVALIGASKTAGSVGSVVASNLFRSGFEGPVMPVNPRHRAIQGVLAYPDIASLPEVPDLAVIATPPPTVPDLVSELGELGTRAVIVISAGFGESGEEGQALEQRLLAAARPHTLRIAGPNCLGILVPGIGLNASFAQIAPIPGHLAFVTQSGAMVTSVLDWATPRGIGFSHLVSLGDMADVDFGDMLDFLASDDKTFAILLYIEGIKHPRKFMSAARAAARMKPVVVVKSGRTEAAAQAAASHTGALAGADAVYDAAFRRAGMLRVDQLEDLFRASETLAMARSPRGDRLTILTNGGGIGVLAVDALISEGGRLAELSETARERLDQVLPPTWSHGNPVDIIGDANGERYSRALEALLEDEESDAVLVLHCPTAVADSTECARAVVEVAAKSRRPILTSWVGEQSIAEGRRLFAQHRVPSYSTPSRAVRAFMELVNYRRNQEMLMETPPLVSTEISPDTQRAREVISAVLADGREWLTASEAAEVVAAYGLPAVPQRTAANPEEVERHCTDLGVPVALKILSPEITHKTDVGGVALDLESPAAARAAAEDMLVRIAERRPDATIEGFLVQPMVERPGAFELIVGASVDPHFGPVILFGHGGTAVEVVEDRALGLPPLNVKLAQEIISRTRISRLLAGYRGRPPADLDALVLALLRVSQLMVDLPEVIELDVNPLLADENGVLAVDARVRVAATDRPAVERLAIRPYPEELEETIVLGDGRELFLRPIVPEDEPALRDAFSRLTPEEIRLRFLTPLKTMTHMMAARFTQLDYDREMALVLTEKGPHGTRPIYGVVRLSADPDNEEAEYAIIVSQEMTGQGLGVLLMRRIIDYARHRGLQTIWGEVLRENRTMRRLCKVLGFRETTDLDDPTLVRVALDLHDPT